jgi:FG-GAP-like repeat
VVVGDVNGDGKPDLVAVADLFFRTANGQLQSGTVAVLLGNGDGTFQPAFKYPVAAGLLSVILGDFNGDGLLDMAVSSGSGTNNPATGVTVLLGNGDGTFRNAVTYAAPNGPLGVGDLNGDGQQDLVIADDFAGMAQVLLNTYVPGISGSVCSPVAPAGN